jgi:hypothetical protein
MYKILTISLITIASLSLTGFNLSKNNKPINTNTNTNNSAKMTNIIAPYCPSGEVTEYSNTNNNFITEHCGICRMGALYEKNGIKVCTYCSNK